MGTRMPELDSDEGPVLVRLLADERQILGVLFVPQSRRRRHRVPVRLGIDRGDLDTDGTPAAVGSRGSKTCLRSRPVTSEAGGVWHLEEAVPQRLRPDADRLEEHVVGRVAGSHPARTVCRSPAVRKRPDEGADSQARRARPLGPRRAPQAA